MSKLIGDRKFYRYVLALMIPIFIQNGITNFVNMLDNVMVGRLGNAPMSGVAIANQLIFIYNLCIFGAVAGAGIFGAQFFGRKDFNNFRSTLRFKIVFIAFVTFVGAFILLMFGGDITKLFLKGKGDPADAEIMLECSLIYIKIMVIGFIPHAIAQCYSSAQREAGKTLEPMIAGIIAVVINLTFNYVLIFGHFGFPRLGVRGAAIATVLSRFAEMAYLVMKTHLGRESRPIFKGTYKHFKIPAGLSKEILKKSFPLMLNETLWALSFTLLAQSFSLRGLDVVAANNICNTFWEVFSVAFLAVGSTVAIVVGQLLGAGEHKKALEDAYKLIFFSFVVSFAVGTIFALCARYIPLLYNTTSTVRDMAFRLMLIDAFLMPFDGVVHAAYFTMRSGGKVYITFAFDSGFAMLVVFPIAYILAHFTPLSIYWIFFLSKGAVILKCIAGILLVKSRTWINTLG